MNNNTEKPEVPASLRFGKDIKIKDDLKQFATDMDRSMNWLIISICKEYVKNKKKSA